MDPVSNLDRVWMGERVCLSIIVGEIGQWSPVGSFAANFFWRQVVPVTSEIGLIEWVQNTRPLKAVIEEGLGTRIERLTAGKVFLRCATQKTSGYLREERAVMAMMDDG